MSDASSYTLVYESNTATKPSVQEFMNDLEKGSEEVKIDAMRRVLITVLNGDPMPQLLMQIIRFVMPSRNKELKKLLHFYWEICPKLQANGSLKQEMILVCNAIRNDLQHPNEYIRGATLRFLCKLKEGELLEPLIPTIQQCLDHRHAYVRKNAVFAVYSISQNNPQLIPDAKEWIHEFLLGESDATCKRNAFVALSGIDREAAYNYLLQNAAGITSLDKLLQLVFIEFMRKDAIQFPENKSTYLTLILNILENASNTVIYDAANALTSLTSNPTAIQTAAEKFIELANKESDNNIKLIVLDRVDQLRIKNPGVLNDLTMNILYVLSSSDIDVRKKAFDIALSMVSSKNVEDVVKLLKKELTKTVGSQDYDKNTEYRQLLIHAIHQCAVQFDEVAASVVDLLLDFLGDFNTNSAVDVVAFVKEVVEIFPSLRKPIIKRLIEALRDVRSTSVYRDALWILGEYCLDEEDIQEAWKHIRKSLGQMPILATERRFLENPDDEEEAEEHEAKKSHGPRVLADGTYASENALTSTPDPRALERAKNNRPPLRALILGGAYFLGAVLSTTLTKLVLRLDKASSDAARRNSNRAEALLIMTSILRVGDSEVVQTKIDEDTVDRVLTCIRALAEGGEFIQRAFLEDSHNAFTKIVEKKQKKQAAVTAQERQKNAVAVDAPIAFRQLKREDGDVDAESEETTPEPEKITSKLNRMVQLTGFSDPVYAEAYVTVHQFDIVLDVLLFNQTNETLQNLSVEFATLGDLKVVERPTTQNVGPQSFHSVQTTIKVSSADAGVIFGNIVYEGHSASVSNLVILNDVSIDIMDYIKPGHCNESEFRTMWSEFEWENKVNISVTWPTLQGFLAYLLKNTNMTCLTPGALTANPDDLTNGADLKDDCQFLSANLHARSTFGEDALANLSIEKDANSKITGHVRIRSKGQGLALSLGDRVADLQRKQQTVSVA